MLMNLIRSSIHLFPPLRDYLTTMSDGGEKTCPLCAEEMDPTDQQLKPCKCGYEICVWCWHHIMEMAEKDGTEGRCPACRAIYDKEKIVGTASSCGRLVAEISVEKKVKSQKAKAKSSEGRKQLSSVRVIQRNLVYIVGLPLNLADEDLLQRREYFGQYGKVLKVSMSRTATGVIQQFPNNTCSVYITYSKEEEAVRCIQNVHQFVLEGKPLRACFGTTKYCHAWLRNVPCTNPDCLYLHEVGSQEDSFTKDEIISAYTRSRVQQITGASNNLQRRSGNVLPPPMDDFCNNSSANGKPIVKNTSSNTVSIRGSPPNGSSDKTIALPAAASWGTRGSNFQAPATSLPSPNGPPKKSDAANSILSFPPAVAGISSAPTVHSEAGKRPAFNESYTSNNAKGHQESLKSLKPPVSMDCQSFSTDRHDSPEEMPSSVSLSCSVVGMPTTKDNQKTMAMSPNISTSTLHIEDSCSCPEAGAISSDGLIQNLSSDMSTVSIDRDDIDDQSDLRPNTLVSDHDLIKASRDHNLQEQFSGQSIVAPLASTDVWKGDDVVNCMSFSREEHDWRSDFQREVINATELEEDVISFNSQRLKDPEIMSPSTRLPGWASTFHALNGSTSHPLWPDAVNGAATSLATDLSFVDKQFNDNSSLNSSSIPPAFSSQLENGVNTSGQSLHTLRHIVANDPANLNADSLFVDKQFNDSSHFHASNISTAINSNMENVISSSAATDIPHGNSFLLHNEGRGRHVGRLSGDSLNANSNGFVDNGENSIISNILSMDFNMWDNTITSQSLAKLLGETDKQPPSSRKVQSNNQSRFSFARQEDSKGQDFRIQPSLDIIGQMQRNQSLRRDFSENGNVHLDKFHNSGGFYSNNYDGSVNHSSNQSLNSSNKLSVSRAQISAPPGFSVPSRVPPPGFSSHDRVDQVSDSLSGNHLLEASSLLRNSYQPNQTGNNISTGDIEFMDPAILAVGKGRRQIGLNNTGLDIRTPFSPSLGTFDNEASLQLLMQRSLNPQQRYSDVGDGFSHLGDSYGISSRLVDQSQVNNLSNFAQLSLQHSRNGLMSHGHWDGWNEVQGGTNIGVADILRNDRLGYNKYYSGYEDSKFRMPTSSDLYNRTFGM
ncbi:uncharacterized protein LOC120088502 isoform X3 [Benincasa hispida]|uniref:uncharacterized protein LOC120088502 isoform X3 n=1 Tax=Benincasa hispida TaxID=102211 RepID=UPI001901B4C7|nr:uncharacterized protein LOC120088502 isoform X3 [Benincasa hispida]